MFQDIPHHNAPEQGLEHWNTVFEASLGKCHCPTIRNKKVRRASTLSIEHSRQWGQCHFFGVAVFQRLVCLIVLRYLLEHLVCSRGVPVFQDEMIKNQKKKHPMAESLMAGVGRGHRPAGVLYGQEYGGYRHRDRGSGNGCQDAWWRCLRPSGGRISGGDAYASLERAKGKPVGKRRLAL